jgi:4-hydroxybenzoate polyprenyltransferase
MGAWPRYTGLALIEARPGVLIVCLLRFLAGAALGSPTGSPGTAHVLVGALGWEFATAAIYVCNGVADRPEDTVNGSKRPIASGRLPAAAATTLVAVFAALALGCSVAAGGGVAAVAALYLVVGLSYSVPPFAFKRAFFTTMPTVAAMGLCTYLAGTLAAGRHPDAGLVVFGVANAVWMAVVGSISKDLSDTRGDREAGRRSWSTVFGQRRARVLLVAACAGFVPAFALAAALWSPRLLWCAGAMLAGSSAVVAACQPAFAARGGRLRARMPYRAFMVTQYLGNSIALGLGGLPL